MDINKMNRNELENFITTKGKIVNRRLRELEKHGYTEASNMYKYNEKKAFDNIHNYYKIKDNTFSYRTDVKNISNINTLKGLALQIQRSYKSKSSTKTDIDNSYKQATKTINEKYGTNFTRKELGELFRVANETNVPYGSDEIITLYKKTNLTPTELIDFLKDNPNLGLHQFIQKAKKQKTEKFKKYMPRKKDRKARREKRRNKKR